MKVNTWFWIRAFLMFCGLVGAITAIRSLNQFKDNAMARINLCPTRITVITTADGVSVVQEGMTWFRKISGRMEELDPIAVEKWFGRHCVVDAEPTSTPGTTSAPVATIAFVSGPEQILFDVGNGVFKWMGQEFTSAELTAALQSLTEIPLRLRPSR